MMTMDEKKAWKIQRTYHRVRIILLVTLLLAMFIAIGVQELC